MATYSFHTLGFSEFGYTGANPFSSAINTNPSAVGSVITLDANASWSNVVVDDDEAHLHDSDMAPAQTLIQPVAIGGIIHNPGAHVETEYEYIVRPTGSSNPADNFSIFAISMDGVIVGFAANQPMTDAASYTIVGEGSIAPSVLYDDLIVCFAEGTMILTPTGERPIESLRPGDRVVTADDGPQPVVWAGARMVRGLARAAPIRLEAGVLGSQRPLLLSPQHRVLAPDWPGEEALVPVKALLGRAGVVQMPRRKVRYHHLLFDRHQVIFANGAPAESLYPGPMALRALGARAVQAIRGLLPDIGEPGEGLWAPARRLLRPRDLKDPVNWAG